MMRTLEQLVRPNILSLDPYNTVKGRYSTRTAHVFLDANENPYHAPLNRYPDPLQKELKSKISKIKGVPIENIFLGNGSVEAIDLVYRIFCRPCIDNVVAIEPTYGMYKVCAEINEVEYRKVLLDEKYQIDAEKLLAACDNNTKVIWICSPNNPTGNNLSRQEIEILLSRFDGIIVVDEAYSDFSKHSSLRFEIHRYPRLIVLNTMSKAWACAGIRLGMAFAHQDIISIYNKVKYPHNVNILTQQEAMELLADPFAVDKWVRLLLQERDSVMEAFRELKVCEWVYPSDANFFLAKMTDAQSIYDYLVGKGIIVRNCTNVALCNNCLCITIGTKTENNELLGALRQYY